MKTFIASIALTLLLATVNAVFAQGIVLELVAASSGQLAYTAEIPLTSVQFGYENSATIGSATSGAGGGKMSINEVVITKPVDASSLIFARNMWAGAHYTYGRISFYRTGASGGRELAYRVAFGTMFTTNITNSAEAGCTSGCPAVFETIKIACGQVALYNPTASSTAVVGWNQVANTGNTGIPGDFITK